MRPRRVIRGLVALAAVTAIVVLSPISPSGRPEQASAADNGLWSVFPTTALGETFARPYFQPLLTPGVLTQDSVSITNKTSQPLNFDIYAADAFNTTEGGFGLRRQSDPKLDMGAWIRLPVDNATVAPHSVEIVPFFIATPIDATPGDHTGGIVALNTVPQVVRSGALSVRSLQAVGTRVYGRVKGPIHPSLAVTDFQVITHTGVVGLLGGPVDSDIKYKVVNTGNIRLDPRSALELSPLIGPSSSPKPLVLPELLPHGSALVEQHVNGVVPVVRLGAKLTETSAGPVTAASTSAWVIPWLLILIIVVLVLLYIWMRRRRRRREAALASGGEPQQAPPTGEVVRT